MTIDVKPQPAKVISLVERITKHKIDVCQHRKIIVDEQLYTVECGDCGAILNPVSMLIRFSREETMWERRGNELKELHAKLDAKVRCKCEHCGRMTRVRP